MSQLTAISPAHLAPNRAPKRSLPSFQTSGVQPGTSPKFPKWNCRDQHPRFSSHSLALRYEAPRATRLPRAHPRGHCLSNRNTPKLKFLVTHTKQSLAQFLIATFGALERRSAANLQPAHRPSPTPALIASKRDSEILENCLTRFHSATSTFLIDNFLRDLSRGFSSHSPFASVPAWAGEAEGQLFCPEQRNAPRLVRVKTRGLCISNRHTYEKLELLLSAFRISETSISNRQENALHPRCKCRLGGPQLRCLAGVSLRGMLLRLVSPRDGPQ